MTSPDRARAVAELDALTDQLPERAAQLARRVDRVLALHGTPGIIVNGRRMIEGRDYCPTCLTHDCSGCGRLHQPPTTVMVGGGLCALHGPADEALCVWCMEPAGTCHLTGGPHQCEGTHEMYALALETAAAPRIWPPVRTGGAA